MKLFLIGFAGALGSIARYLVSGWAANSWGSGFPVGTLAVNVIGSFLIGVVMLLSLETNAVSPLVRVTLVIGFLGGFTTYSSFNYETVAYLQNGEVSKALINALVMLISCCLSGIFGIAAGKWLLSLSS